MQLTMVRHSDAENYSIHGDRGRCLTEAGIQKALIQAKNIKDHIDPELLLSSPYVRARQTAGIFAGVLGIKNIQFSSDLIPSAGLEDVLVELEAYGQSKVLIVGHNPHISQLSAYLLKGEAQISFETSMVVSMRFKGRALPDQGEFILLKRPARPFLWSLP